MPNWPVNLALCDYERTARIWRLAKGVGVGRGLTCGLALLIFSAARRNDFTQEILLHSLTAPSRSFLLGDPLAPCVLADLNF